jgi:hypothetical protein
MGGFDAFAFFRSFTSGALWFAVSYGMGMASGSNPSLIDCAMDAGVMTVSVMASDSVHGLLDWEATGTTSAVLTGASFAAAQKLLRNSDDYFVNGGLAAANDFAVEKLFLGKSKSPAAEEDE